MYYEVALAEGKAEIDEDLRRLSSENCIIPSAEQASKIFRAKDWQKSLLVSIAVATANEQNYAMIPDDGAEQIEEFLKKLGYEVDDKMGLFFWPKG